MNLERQTHSKQAFMPAKRLGLPVTPDSLSVTLVARGSNSCYTCM